MAVNTFTGATNNNWGTSTNWSEGTVPTASDGHVTTFDAASPKCIIDGGNKVCNALDSTDYADADGFVWDGTARTITVSGNITFGAGMNDDGNITLATNVNLTLTSNGYKWKGLIDCLTSKTITLADNLNIARLQVYLTTFTGTKDIYIYNEFRLGHSSSNNGVLRFVGGVGDTVSINYYFVAGTWTGAVVMDTAGTLTFNNNAQRSRFNGTITYTAGTITFGVGVAGQVGFSGCTISGFTSSHKFPDLYLINTGNINTFNCEVYAEMVYINSNSNSGTPGFKGTHGFNFDKVVFEITTSAFQVHTRFEPGRTYKINNILQCIGSVCGFISHTASSNFNLILGANCKVYCANITITDCDASGGKKLKVFNGTLLRTTNVESYNSFYFDDELPPIAEVKSGTKYGDVRGTEYTGTMASGGGAFAHIT
jgi:hypothetical protein